MGHQLYSRTVDSEKSFLSLGFTWAGLSRALLNLCQSLGLSSKCRASAISCSARTHALSKIKFVMFTPRCSAPRRMSFASLPLSRMLNLSVRLFRAMARICGTLPYTKPVYVQCTLTVRTCQASKQACVYKGNQSFRRKPESEDTQAVGRGGGDRNCIPHL